MTLNQKIALLRKKKGLSQEEFAYEIGVSRQSVFKWESGDNTPDIDKIKKIAKFFDISLDKLLNDDFEIEDPQITVKKTKKQIEPFEITSVKKNKKWMKILGAILIPASILEAVFCYFVFENIYFKYIAMGAMVFVGFIGVFLLVLSSLFKNDFLRVNENGISGCSYGTKFEFTYQEIEFAKVFNVNFGIIGIKSKNRTQPVQLSGLSNAEIIIKKINEILEEKNND